MRYFSTLLLILIANIGLSQVTTFPYSESFEDDFLVGANIAFLPNWTGNLVADNNRIFQGNNPRSGSHSVNIIPTSSFKAEALLSLDLTNISNPEIQFFAYSKRNGSSSSTRPVLLTISTSIDGGSTYFDNTNIGGSSTFPNDNTTSFSPYTYPIPIQAANHADVVIKFTAIRGSGSGSAAELIIDDLTIIDQPNALDIVSIETLSDTSLVLTFNQEVAEPAAELSSNYSIDKDIQILSATRSLINQVILYVSPMSGNTYRLTANNIQNAHGIKADSLTFDFSYIPPIPTIARPRQIVINEIFADPTGSFFPIHQVLPDNSSDEYIELFNTSHEAIDIGGFELSGGTIESFVLEANSYVILTASNNIPDFQIFGDVISVSSWNTLSNGGEAVYLKDSSGELIDSLWYDQDWYQSLEKSDGGWSLEQINPLAICSDANNWSASVDTKGGTPGVQNSIYNISPDTLSPNLVHLIPKDSLQIIASFSEIMDQSSLAGANYNLNNGLSIINVLTHVPDQRSVTLTLDSPLSSGSAYELNIEGVTDCSENPIDSGTLSFLYDVKSPILKRIILRDFQTLELLFDEILDPKNAATESNYLMNQDIGTPLKAKIVGAKPYRVILEFQRAMSLGNSYSITYESIADTLGNTSGNMTAEFTFENNIDTVIVISDQLLDIHFDVDLDPLSAQMESNFSLDRDIGNPHTSALDSENPRLLHLVFDDSFRPNVPQTIIFDNLKDSEGNFIQLLNSNFIYDTDDPDVDSLDIIDRNHILVYFDEMLEQTSAEAINHYEVDNSIGHPGLVTLLEDRTSVLLEFTTPFTPETEYLLSIRGIEDPSGNSIRNRRNNRFVFDDLAPSLADLKVLSPDMISIEFSELLNQSQAEEVNNYFIDNGIGHPLTANLSQKHPNKVLLTFTHLGINFSNQLTISNISDVLNNQLIDEIVTTFSSDRIEIGSIKVLSDTSLKIQFTKYLNEVSKEDFELSHGLEIRAIALHPTDGSILNMVFERPLKKRTNYGMVLGELSASDGSVSIGEEATFQYDNQVKSIIALSPNSVAITFDADVDKTSSETLSNYSLNEIGNPLSAVRNKKEHNEITLLFALPLNEDFEYALNIQNVQDIYGEPLPSSTHTVSYDQSPPYIIRINSIFSNEIEVIFNEVLDPNTAQVLNHYALRDAFERPIAASLKTDNPKIVTLQFDKPLLGGQSYQLTVNRVEDRQGQAVHNLTFDFIFESLYDPQFREIVINEIYFDTDVEAALPNTEFIELFNRSPNAIQLRGFSIADNRDTAKFSNFVLDSGAYLIVTSMSAEGNFSSYGEARGLFNFPSLSNSGERISFINRAGSIIDSLHYSPAHYHDDNKSDGGHSVELINPERPCFDVSNYAASTDVKGGTPGTNNAVFDSTPDSNMPVVLSLTALSTTQLRIQFDEAMDLSTLTPSNFVLQDGVSVTSLEVNDPFGLNIELSLNEPFQKGLNQKLTLNGVSDCSGNALFDSEYIFHLGATPLAHDIIITEVMSSPNSDQGLPDVEYLELLNTSDKIISLEGLRLADATGFTNLSMYDLAPDEYLLLAPTSGSEALSNFGNVLAVSGWRNLNSSGDNVSISSGTEPIFEVNYTKAWYRSSLKSSGGFSLEMIDTDYPCLEETNWKASESPIGGTPGEINSVTANNPDIIGPSMVSAQAISASALQISFDEKMNLNNVSKNNFNIVPDLEIDSVELGPDNHSIILSTEVFQENMTYVVSAENITDCSGNLILAAGNQVALIIPTIADSLDVILNEVLFNPKTGGVRFVEIYNNSNKNIDLFGWSLVGPTEERLISDHNLIIQPTSFKVITNDMMILKDQYPQADQTTFIEIPSMPHLPSREGSVGLINDLGKAIDFMNYSEEYHSQLLDDVRGVSLERIQVNASSIDPNNWFSASSSQNFASPGRPNSQFLSDLDNQTGLTVEPRAFAPDDPGGINFTTLHYSFDKPGNVITATVFDAQGNKIKVLQKNLFVGTSGFFRWDGTNEQGAKARIGYYMILLEIVNSDGSVLMRKEGVAIGGRF